MKYTVKLYPRAYRDLDEIYSYIAVNLTEPDTASNMVAALEEAIFSLEQFPKRGSIRKVGVYANQDYRQIFVKNYTIIYRVYDEKTRGAYCYGTLRVESILILKHKKHRDSDIHYSCADFIV